MNDMRLETLAMLAHEMNKTFCEINGDFSQRPWDEAEEWQKQSARDGVMFVARNPFATASATHDSWLASKSADGWKYGPVKNPEKKEHPCIVPFNELPWDQQMKDYLFKTVVLTGIRLNLEGEFENA